MAAVLRYLKRRGIGIAVLLLLIVAVGVWNPPHREIIQFGLLFTYIGVIVLMDELSEKAKLP